MNKNQSTIIVAFDGTSQLGKLKIEGQIEEKQCRIEDMMKTIELSVQKGTGFLSRQSDQVYQFSSNNRVMKFSFERPQNYAYYINQLNELINIQQNKIIQIQSQTPNNNNNLGSIDAEYTLTDSADSIICKKSGTNILTDPSELLNRLNKKYNAASVTLTHKEDYLMYQFNLDQVKTTVIWRPDVARVNAQLISQIIEKYRDIKPKEENIKPDYVDFNCIRRVLRNKKISFVTLVQPHIGYRSQNHNSVMRQGI